MDAAAAADAAPPRAKALTPLEQAEVLIDMRAPLLSQIGRLTKEQYLAWVHVSHHYAEEPKCARLFASDFLEAFSKTAWWVVPAVWLPVCAALWAPYLRSAHADAAEAAVLLVSGVFIWTFVEYSLHRWVFHVDGATPDHPAALTAHFLIHGVHHKIPLDRYRLVMPPVMLAPLAAGVYAASRLLIPIESGIITHEAWHAMYASGLAGYVAYDVFHYAQHHAGAGAWRYLAHMKRYHMKHHFAEKNEKNEALGFGVTSTFWDVVFGTVLPLPELPSRPTAAAAADKELKSE